jgi:ADP-heptose:LPS heptosyltransferase
VRVLIVKRDKLGDLLLTTPVLARLAAARPDASIHLLANDYNAWVARDHPALARTWTYPRVRDAGRLRLSAVLAQLPLRWRLTRAGFDVAIVMGGDESPRGIRRAIGTGARRVIAYADDPARYGRRLTDALPVPRDGHEVERMLGLLAPLGVAPVDPAAIGDPAFTLPPAPRAFAQRWLRERGLAEGRFVVIGLGARRAKKQPETAQIVRWSRQLWRAHGLATVFMWTPGARDAAGYPGDDAIAAPVLAHELPHLHPFRGAIDEAVALIWHARTSVLPDSGLMHFAAASPGGVLGFFADPADGSPAARWAPRGPRARYLEAARRVGDLDDDTVFAALGPLLEPSATAVVTADARATG